MLIIFKSCTVFLESKLNPYLMKVVIPFLFIISCNKSPRDNYSIISGKITNLNEEILLLKNSDQKTIDTFHLSFNGDFRDTLKIFTGHGFLSCGKLEIPIYVDEGFNLFLSYNTSIKKAPVYSGIGSEINNYLIYKKKKVQEFFSDKKSLFLLAEDEYKRKIFNLNHQIIKYFDSNSRIDKAFISREQRILNYAYCLKLLEYEYNHGYFLGKVDFKVSDDFYSTAFDSLNLENEIDFKSSKEYRKLLKAYYMRLAEDISRNKKISIGSAYLSLVSQNKNNFIKNALLLEDARVRITITNELDKYYNAFIKNSTNKENNIEITKTYNQLKALEKGMKSPNFNGYENFSGGTSSLNDFTGKYIFIDIWATWCGPCIAELPYLNNLIKMYSKENIEFISISIDSEDTYATWKQMLKAKKVKGIQLIADKSFNSEFILKYNIKTVPRYIIIDPEGYIVNSKAPRPSNPKLKNILDSLKDLIKTD